MPSPKRTEALRGPDLKAYFGPKISIGDPLLVSRVFYDLVLMSALPVLSVGYSKSGSFFL